MAGDRDGRAADAGRAVADQVWTAPGRVLPLCRLLLHAGRKGEQASEEGGRHDLAHAGGALGVGNAEGGPAAGNGAELAPAFGQGLLRTDGKAAAAAVAHVGKELDLPAEARNGAVAADLPAGAAGGAGRGDAGRHGEVTGLGRVQDGLEEDVEVRRLHVGVDHDVGPWPHPGERGRNAGLACASLAAGDGDAHARSAPSPAPQDCRLPCWGRRQGCTCLRGKASGLRRRSGCPCSG